MNLPGTHINGKKNTQGENIADLGGLEIGITAFKKTDAYKNEAPSHTIGPLPCNGSSWATL